MPSGEDRNRRGKFKIQLLEENRNIIISDLEAIKTNFHFWFNIQNFYSFEFVPKKNKLTNNELHFLEKSNIWKSILKWLGYYFLPFVLC